MRHLEPNDSFRSFVALELLRLYCSALCVFNCIPEIISLFATKFHELFHVQKSDGFVCEKEIHFFRRPGAPPVMSNCESVTATKVFASARYVSSKSN